MTAPTKKFMISALLKTMYPFLNNIIKVRFGQPGVDQFFIELMQQAIKHREEHKTQRIDYLDHLITLKNKKEISGIFGDFTIDLTLRFHVNSITDLDIAGHGVSFLLGEISHK